MQSLFKYMVESDVKHLKEIRPEVVKYFETKLLGDGMTTLSKFGSENYAQILVYHPRPGDGHVELRSEYNFNGWTMKSPGYAEYDTKEGVHKLWIATSAEIKAAIDSALKRPGMMGVDVSLHPRYGGIFMVKPESDSEKLIKKYDWCVSFHRNTDSNNIEMFPWGHDLDKNWYKLAVKLAQASK